MTFRPDIEGLRALSILFVLVYHLFPAVLPGGYVGVDVFFVVSGYLITLSLIDIRARGLGLGASLATFWARRARRLLPNALLVLVVVSLTGWWVLSDFAIKRLGSDVFWSATYSVNWLYVLRSLDYLQWDDSRISVLLNYWSLAVEEQFYFVWPAVLLLVLRVHGPDDGRRRRRAIGVAAALAGLSFAYCLVLSSSHLTLSFFSSPARAWELLAGATLALWSSSRARPGPEVRRGRVLAEAGVVASLIAMACAALAFGEDTPHPGWATLLPVGGALGVIAFGAASRLGQRALGCLPMRAVGSRSYSIYLWHWPVLVLGRQWLGATPLDSFLILAVALLLAELAYRYVELPARFRWGPGLSARSVLVAAAVSSAGVAALGFGLRAAGAGNVRELLALKPGAVAGARPALQLRQAASDLPENYRLGCHLALEQVEQGECTFGDTRSTRSAVLFGDSHAAQWLPALDVAAKTVGFRLHAWTKSSCPSASVSVWNQMAKGPYRQCDDWREQVFRRIESEQPAIVFLSNLVEDATALAPRSGSRPIRGRDAQQAYQEGLEQTIRRLRAAGATVVVIRDTPRPRPDIMDCLASTTDARKCELGRAEATLSAPLDARAAESAGARTWDFTDQICPGSRCPVSGGPDGLLVYRDSNHLTARFVASLAPEAARRWRQEIGAGGTTPPGKR